MFYAHMVFWFDLVFVQLAWFLGGFFVCVELLWFGVFLCPPSQKIPL